MANIGSLDVDLTMKTARFNSDVAKAQKKVNSFKNSVKRDMKTISRAADQARKSFNTFAKVGVGLAAVSLGLIVKRSLEVNDQMVKTADKIGIATDKLAGLRHAASITGVESKALDKGLQTMQKTIADLSKGIGIAAADYKKLGLSSRDLLSVPADEQFKLIAERLNQVENATERVGIAYNIFGGRGTALINTLALGREGMDKMQQEAYDLGIALNRVDAAKIEEANDAMTRTGEAMQGIGNKFTVAVAPFIVAFGNKITDIVKDANSMGNDVSGAFEKVANAVGFVANALRGLEVVFKTLNIIAVSFVSGAITALDELQKAAATIANIIPGMDIKPSPDLSKWAEESRATVVQLQQELLNLVDKPMPAEGVKLFMRQVQAEADKVAEEIAAKAAERGIGAASQGGGADEAAGQAKLASKLKYYEQLQAMGEQQLLTEEESLTLKHERELAKIQAHQQVLIEHGMTQAQAKQEMDAAIEISEATHWDKITKIRAKAMTSAQKLTQMSFKDQVKTVTSSLMQMTASASTQSRAMFEINKAASIANAVVAGIDAVQSSYKVGAAFGGPIGGAAMAGIAAAATALNVAKIASTSFGGGGAGAISGGGGGGGGGIPSQALSTGVPVAPVDQQGAGGPSFVVNMTLAALDPSSVDSVALERIGEALSPIMKRQIDNNLDEMVTA